MENKGFIEESLSRIADPGALLLNEPMRLHTTFRVGGNADFYIEVSSAEQLKDLVSFLSKQRTPFFVLGNGSNLLVSDAGYRGVILSLSKYFQRIEVLSDSAEGSVILAESGALLGSVSKTAMEAGLKGLEFASGIPGSVGGAIVMNAGAYGGEMKQVVESVTLLDTERLAIEKRSCKEMEFSYRDSLVKHGPYIVLETRLRLFPGNREEIRALIEELRQKRVEKQPLEYPSAGSTFKRPEGYFAGKLIEDSGLRGYRVGDAQVSEKHCGFVINRGHATAAEIMTVIRDVSRIVLEKQGVQLTPEIVMLGDFNE
ncbi:MAG: UDP-N-acetylmuramate dehydrogenase [Lachnospiraceae bacterium]|nr:UDP-N-acetylmuramate dehydrogenase [Lachnospiraceae bacterium]